jgi:hypothetical protein
MKNILIVDDDLPFIEWLCELLIGANHQPWPACTVEDAITIVGLKPLVPLDLLVVNPSLPEISELIALYGGSQAPVKVLATGLQNEAILPDVKFWREKPIPGDESERQAWARAIENIASGHEWAA